jgi:hypothetical protein
MNQHQSDCSSIQRPIDGGDELGGPRVAMGGKRGRPAWVLDNMDLKDVGNELKAYLGCLQ